MKRLLSLILLLSMGQVGFSTNLELWKKASTSELNQLGNATIKTKSSLQFKLDMDALSSRLNLAPAENSSLPGVVLEVPFPDGSMKNFLVKATPIVPMELQNKYPGIKTWSGKSIEDPSSVIYLDVTLWGFHGMIFSEQGTVYIDPYNSSNTEFYKVYWKNEAISSSPISACGFDASTEENKLSVAEIRTHVQRNGIGNNVARSAGGTLRTYRTAIACTGEYSSFHGGTVPLVLSAIVTSLNRVTGVYEQEVATRLVLVPNNDTLIFLVAASDPYTNSNGGTMLGQNQSTVAARIGNGNYDIGHVFSTGGGGIAGLGVICNATQKARGVTGSPSPINDPFNIDYVAHEMGHQFGANHTFNSNTSGCSGNGNSSTAFEPGSGTTIMAYAGLCGSNNTQNFSDPYFHTASFDEIQDYTTLSTGATCGASSGTGNTPPVITSVGTDHAIPYQTPFLLEGVANDPDGDPIKYSWEQYDLGPFGSPTSPSGNAPLFRSIIPTTSPIRYFPKLSAIVAGTTSLGERLPTYARDMQFRLTVRDNKLGGGGVTYEEVAVTLTVINTGAPFLVTAPNTNITWVGGTQENITWNVVGTDVAPINAANVDIFLSTDGGFTYPTTLATGVPNTGMATVTVPGINSTTARVMVRGAGNVFFDISNVNFTITNTQALNENTLTDNVRFYPNPSNGLFNMSIAGDFRGDVLVSIADMSGRIVEQRSLNKGNSGLIELIDLSALPKGVYTGTISTSDGLKTQKLVIAD
ncbi:MAG: T9SS type A sorting domain-containing protein [Bacteroidetes bacterium]|nr:T9SS type A sorting domain-containing protein [Bacteroidota bacterium]